MSKVSLLGDEYEIDMSIIKMEQVASHLVGLLRHSNFTRAELAVKLGWRKSRITKVLSGDENLTIRTITSVSEKLGYDFDIVFYNRNYEKPKQPWQIDRENKQPSIHVQQNTIPPEISFEFQTGEQVVLDVLAGTEKDFYIVVKPLTSLNISNVIHVEDKENNVIPLFTYQNQNIRTMQNEPA